MSYLNEAFELIAEQPQPGHVFPGAPCLTQWTRAGILAQIETAVQTERLADILERLVNATVTEQGTTGVEQAILAVARSVNA